MQPVPAARMPHRPPVHDTRDIGPRGTSRARAGESRLTIERPRTTETSKFLQFLRRRLRRTCAYSQALLRPAPAPVSGPLAPLRAIYQGPTEDHTPLWTR